MRVVCWFFVALVIVVGMALAGCGKKGDLKYPENQPNSFPRTYPTQ